jgi:hypothetical protein
MSSTGNVGKAAATGGLLIAACAACCAPLIAPWVIGAMAAGGAILALMGQVGLALALVVGGGVYIWSRRRKAALQRALPTDTGKSCGCAADAGCNVGDACELPATKPGLLARVRALC